MDHRPKISIVTPSFNRRWSIEACIRSLQNQTEQDYEHIIVDGGSTDGTVEAINTYSSSDSRILCTTEPDDGMYDAINKGLKKTSGEIVAYINTDDFYIPNAFEVVVAAFSANPEVSIIYGNWMSWHPAIEFLEILPVQKFRALDIATFATLPQPSVFIRRSIFNAIGYFDTSYKLLADNEFFSRVVAAGFECLHVDSYLSAQTVHSENLLVGNISAVEQATTEGTRYRQARRQEIHENTPFMKLVFPLAMATFRRLAFPINWRINLICHIIYCSFSGEVETNRAPWLKIEGSWSSKELLRYLFAREKRQKNVFFKVTSATFGEFLRFAPPDPQGNVLEANHHRPS